MKREGESNEATKGKGKLQKKVLLGRRIVDMGVNVVVLEVVIVSDGLVVLDLLSVSDLVASDVSECLEGVFVVLSSQDSRNDVKLVHKVVHVLDDAVLSHLGLCIDLRNDRVDHGGSCKGDEGDRDRTHLGISGFAIETPSEVETRCKSTSEGMARKDHSIVGVGGEEKRQRWLDVLVELNLQLLEHSRVEVDVSLQIMRSKMPSIQSVNQLDRLFVCLLMIREEKRSGNERRREQGGR
jgi:hypothetical protein